MFYFAFLLATVPSIAVRDMTSSPRLHAALLLLLGCLLNQFLWKQKGLERSSIFIEGLLGCRQWYEGDLHRPSHLIPVQSLDADVMVHISEMKMQTPRALLVREHTAGQGQDSTQADPKAHLTDGLHHQLPCCSFSMGLGSDLQGQQ